MASQRILLKLLYGIRRPLHTTSRKVQKSDISQNNIITAGIIVIGDEILKGQVHDSNSHFIAKNLTELGVKVKKVSVIADELDEISDEVRHFSEQYSYVITTGGIGPTHDDLTFEGVAKAFGECTKPHPELVKIIEGLYRNKGITPAALKFAHVPSSAKLMFGFDEARGRKMLFPNVSVRNVYIFPGVPDLMERSFKSVYKELFGKGCKQLFKMNVYVSEKEFLITDVLNTVVKKFPSVIFGSYPKYFHSYYDVHLTIESEDKQEVEEACECLKASLPKGSVVDYDLYPLRDAHRKVVQLAQRKGSTNILNSLKQLQQCYQKYKPEEVCLLLDSSVESTAALHLVHSHVRKHDADAHLRGFCVDTKKNFPEMDMYIKEAVWRYTVDCDMYETAFEEAVEKLLVDKPSTKAIIVGCPLSDIKTRAEQHLEDVRSHVEYINVLDGWTTDEVWMFVRSLYLPYFYSKSQM